MSGELIQIEDWRIEIDAIDEKLVKLLNQELLPRAIDRFKRQIYEPQREEIIMKSASEANAGLLPISTSSFKT